MALRLALSTRRSARVRSGGGLERQGGGLGGDGRRGRAPPGAPLGALAVLAPALAGCGAESHANAPRPQPPTRVSVAISDEGVEVQPPRIAIGPEPTQQIPQNVHAGQPQVRSNAPLDVVLVAANLTDTDSVLEVRGQGEDLTSEALVANGNISLA